MRAAIRQLFRGLAIVAALLATVQPVLGSFAFFRRDHPVNYEAAHLLVGAVLFIIVILLVLLALFTRLRRRWQIFALGLALCGLIPMQLLLGFVGSNTDARLLGYHIPVGVLILLLSFLMAALSFGLRLDSSHAAREAQAQAPYSKR